MRRHEHVWEDYDEEGFTFQGNGVRMQDCAWKLLPPGRVNSLAAVIEIEQTVEIRTATREDVLALCRTSPTRFALSLFITVSDYAL